MTPLKLLGLLLSVATIRTHASPLSRVHVRFFQPPHVQEHGITTDGGRVIEQQSYLSIGRRNSPPNSRAGHSMREYYSNNLPQQAVHYSQRSSFSPFERNEVNYGDRQYNQHTPDFSNGLDYPDPLLLTGDAARRAVSYLYGRGELFFGELPHARALLRSQEERRQNGLQGHLLSSIRPYSPWYRAD